VERAGGDVRAGGRGAARRSEGWADGGRATQGGNGHGLRHLITFGFIGGGDAL